MPTKYDLERLKGIWQRQLKGIDPTDELVLIRIVTILAVFCGIGSRHSLIMVLLMWNVPLG
jgi:hypothetical protein